MQRLLGELRVEDRVLVLAIERGRGALAAVGRSPRGLRRAAGPAAWGTTPLFDATLDAISAIQGAAGRRALILISDGTDRYSSVSAGEMVARARRGRARVSGSRPTDGAGGVRAAGERHRCARGGGAGFTRHRADAVIDRDRAPPAVSDRLRTPERRSVDGPVAVDHRAGDQARTAGAGARGLLSPAAVPLHVSAFTTGDARPFASSLRPNENGTAHQGTPFAVAAAKPVRHNTSTSLIPLPMAERTPSGEPHGEPPVNASAGHLSVHIEGVTPPEVMFSFERQSQRLVPAFGVALLLDVAIVLLFVLISRYGPSLDLRPAALPEDVSDHIIWLSEPGPGGGGGGGGNQMKEPPRKAELPARTRLPFPSRSRRSSRRRRAKNEPDPIEQLNIPAKTLAAAQDSLPGAIEAPPGPPTLSQGSGSGGGAGTGTGTGIGPGTGSGLGPGSGGGTGGGVYRPGNGVTLPRVLREVEAAVHLGRDAREGSGHRAPRMRRAARRQRRRRAGRPLARLRRSASIRRRSKPRGSGASRPARAWASRSPVLITIELTFTLPGRRRSSGHTTVAWAGREADEHKKRPGELALPGLFCLYFDSTSDS